MKRNQFINMAWMQALWFAAVIGAAYGSGWPAVTLLALFTGWQLQPERRQNSDLVLLPIAVFIGMILDTAWIMLGWIEFSNPGPVPGIAPLWILVLWAGFSLTLSHSLAWLQNRLLTAGLIAGLVGPLSYLAAQRLGALHIMIESSHWVFGLGVAWALALPFLFWLAEHLKETDEERM